MSDLISRQDAINAIQEWGLIDGLAEAEALEILLDKEKVPSAEPEIIRCKDCRKHNQETGYYSDGHVVHLEDSCPLIAYRGKAQGHEFDYQYCVCAERKYDE